MQKILMTAALALGLTALSGAATELISYNIGDGFNAGRETARMEKCAAWIESKAPAVVALQDLRGMDVAAFAKRYGHTQTAVQTGFANPVAVSSSSAVEKVADTLADAPAFGFLHVRTAGYDVVNVQFTPGSAAARFREAQALRAYLRGLPKENQNRLILAGDFNAVSPFDWDELLEKYPGTVKSVTGRDNEDGRGLDFTVMHTLYSTPLIDPIRRAFRPAARLRNASASAPTPDDIRKGSDFFSVRTVGILVSDSVMEKKPHTYLWNGPETRGLSDHFPVGIVLPAVK